MTVEKWLRGFDSLPRIWDGDTVFILGGGPSLRNFDFERLRGRQVIATNEAFLECPWARALCFVDINWWNKRGEEVKRRFRGMLISRGPHRPRLQKDGVLCCAMKTGLRWSTDPRMLAGSNSGLVALNAACLMGAGRAVLLGFDMRAVDGRANYHGRHRMLLNQQHRGNSYTRTFLGEFEKAAQEIRGSGFEVVNATPGSAMKWFPMVELEDELQ